jgi:hypothetical protein
MNTFENATTETVKGAQGKADLLGMLGRRCAAEESANSADLASVLFRVLERQMTEADRPQLSRDSP